MKFFNQAEGYITPDGAGNYSYVYQYKDHLGNIRLSYTDSNDDGIMDTNEITSEKNYYPFGLIQKGYNSQVQGTYHPYGFGGKEEQSELDLEWLDFSARNYDASIGRWMNMDLLADANGQVHNSPYNYALNNPVVLTDPDGNCPPGVNCFSVVMGVFNTAKSYYSSVAKSYANTANSAAQGVKQLVSDPVGTVKAAAADHVDRISNPARLIGDTVEAISTVNPVAGIASDAVTGITSDNPASAAGNAKGERLFNQTMAVAGEGAGAALGKGVSVLGKSSTTVYRAVSKAELDDIPSNGLRNIEGQYETGKLFTDSAENASQFGKYNFKFDSKSNTIIKVEVPNSVMKTSTSFNADSMPAILIPSNQLQKIKKITPLNSSPIPNN